jgi:hypothetical protein
VLLPWLQYRLQGFAHPEATEAHTVDQQLLAPAVLPAFALKQAKGEKAGLRAQLRQPFSGGLAGNLLQQGAAIPLALMGWMAVEQGDTIDRFAHSKSCDLAIAIAVHQSSPSLQNRPQGIAFSTTSGLPCPGVPLLRAVELGGASLHRLAIHLKDGLLISVFKGSQPLHLPVHAQFTARFSWIAPDWPGILAGDVVGLMC